MTSPQPQPQPPPQPDPPATQGGDSERIRRLEEHQGVVDGKLDKILGMLQPGDGDGKAPVTQGNPPPPPVPDIGEQMRQAIRDVNAEQQQKPGQQAPPPEKPPREIGVRGKGRLQRALFGGDR